MTMFAPTAPDVLVTTCPQCDEPVFAVYTTTQRRVVLDADRSPQGLFELDEHGRAYRRPLRLLIAEGTGTLDTGGYAVHADTCAPESTR